LRLINPWTSENIPTSEAPVMLFGRQRGQTGVRYGSLK
jgi:hypothetical protein